MTVQEAAASVGRSVVGLGRGARGGSGVVVAQDRVLTLAHQLRGDEVEVVLGERHSAGRLEASDLDLDLALLSVETGDAPPVRWAEQAAPGIGTRVFALADPGGTGLRATEGAMSAAPMRVRGRRGRPVQGVLEHTAPLPRGSGGGPLTDESGAVLGLNARRQPGGFILALPATEVVPRLQALLAGRPAPGRRLGIAVLPPRAARRLRRSVGLPDQEGLLVRAVEDDSPAGRAGLQRGDLITELAGRTVGSIDELYAALDHAPANGAINVRLLRGAEELELAIALPGGEGEEPQASAPGGEEQQRQASAPGGGEEESGTSAPGGGEEESGTSAPGGGEQQRQASAPGGGEQQPGTSAPGGGEQSGPSPGKDGDRS